MKEINIIKINKKLEEIDKLGKDDDKDVDLNNLKFYLKNILSYNDKLEGHLENILDEVNKEDLDNLKVNNELCEKIKKGNLYLSWINDHFDYVKDEDNNNYFKRTYKRKDIIRLNFGFNVGSELGGIHYAVVVEKDDSMHDSTLVVVPLSTFRKKGKNIDDLYPTEVDLGVIDDLIENDEEIYSYALIDQIRLISKVRIYEPRSNKDLPARLSNEQMDLIDEKIIHFFSKQSINPVDCFDELDKTIWKYIEYKQHGDKYEEHLLNELSIIYKEIFD